MALDLMRTFERVDAMDARGFAECFTPDGLFRFGNAPTAKGRSEITSAVDEFFASIKGLRHNVLERWVDGDVEIAEVEATYTRHDGSEISLMAACVFRMDGDLIDDYRIYMDISPLFAAP